MQLNRDMKNGKKLYWCTYFDMYRNDMKKKTWEGIMEVVNIKVGLNFNRSEINRNGKSITNPKDNNFFANVGPNTENYPKTFHKSN